MAKRQNHKIVKCSFCGRDGSEVGSMIAGPDVYICDICIGSSVDILKIILLHIIIIRPRAIRFILPKL